jgi:hypothetical protein
MRGGPARWAARVAAFASVLATATASAATFQIIGGAGFNDTTPRAPEGGNSGTTLGQQRQILFQAAADVWGAQLGSAQTIKVAAEFVNLTCSPSSGVLGAAGPTNFLSIGSGANERFFSIAEAEALLGTNENGAEAEIDAQFNAQLDNQSPSCLGGNRWYYGLSGPAPAGTIALFPTVLHELAHGLGFLTLLCTNSGGCTGPTTPQGGYFFGIPDAWSDFMLDRTFNNTWINLSNAQRVASFTNNGNLVWNGTNVTAAIPVVGLNAGGQNGGRVRMYAPLSFEPGSSLSHFDEPAVPNLLMEPIADADVFSQTDFTVPLFRDIGWPVAVNQAPSITRPASITVLEDTPSSLAGISYADPDAGTGNLTATFTVAQGTLNATSGFGVTVGGSASNRTLSGTLANLNSFVANGRITYTTAAEAQGTVTLNLAISDNGNSGSGGPLSDSDSTTLNITATNDAPTVTAPATIGVLEDAASVVSGITAADVDIGGGNLTLTFAVPSGSLAASNFGGVTVSGSGSASLVLTGTLAAVNSFVAQNRVSFLTAANATAPVQLTLTANDLGNTGAGGAQSGGTTTMLMVGAVNDAPTITAPATLTVAEDVASSLAGIAFADVDAGSTSVTATFTVASGSISSPSCAGVTPGGSGGARTLAGTLANLNACIAGNNLRFTTAPNDLASVTLGVAINDNGSSGSGGPLSATTSVTLNVTAVNDAPVITAPPSIAVTEDQAGVLAGYSVADVDAGGADLVLTLAVPSGTLSASDFGGVQVTGSGTTTLQLTGTVGELNAFVAGNRVSYLTAPNATLDVTLSLQANDGGASGSGGAQTGSANSTIIVSAVNDAPTLQAPAAIGLAFAGTTDLTGIVVADVDAGVAPVQLTLAVDAGTLTATTGGGVTVTGSGSTTLVLTGPQASINGFIAGRNVDYAGGDATLTSTVDDQGNSGGGALSASTTTGLFDDGVLQDSFENP